MTLRPKNFDGIIGQDNVKACLKIAIESARKRGDVLNHSLFLGPAGTGKTTLALATAHELGSNILLANGGNIAKLKDVTPYLSRLQFGDVLFIDEVHRVNKRVQEALFTVMEDFRLDISKGCQSIHYKPFTLIGATTEAGMLLRPFYDRFIHQFQLENYSIEELCKIININLIKLNINASGKAVKNIAQRSRFTPRIANSLLQWCRDYAISINSDISDEIVNKSMNLKKIDKNGLDRADRQYIMVLKRAGKPLGLQTIVATTGLSRETIEHQIEPFLFKLGMIEKSSKGRMLVCSV
jgi:Holliday junction DNA helicase RuvB